MIPIGIEKLGATVTPHVDDAICHADVVMVLRIQTERQYRCRFPTEREYARFFGLTSRRLERAKKNVLVMHPGPINRGIEISPEVADGPYSIILDQVTNGVAVRMALLYLVGGGVRDEYPD
jgi:aspartate carbamoyltransferase catalytic subunit